MPLPRRWTMGRPGFTLGIGPSHAPVIEGMYGMSYATPGRHTEEYVTIVAGVLRGEAVAFAGDDLTLRGVPAQPVAQPVQLLVAALAPRLLRVAGAVADGTILWMGNAKAVESHVAPRLAAAAADAGRPTPRIVAGLPVAVHDDVAEARAVAAEQFAIYGQLPNYQRILAHGGVDNPADAAIVGDEATVAAAAAGPARRRGDRHLGGDLPRRRRRRPGRAAAPAPCCRSSLRPERAAARLRPDRGRACDQDPDGNGRAADVPGPRHRDPGTAPTPPTAVAAPRARPAGTVASELARASPATVRAGRRSDVGNLGSARFRTRSCSVNGV